MTQLRKQNGKIIGRIIGAAFDANGRCLGLREASITAGDVCVIAEAPPPLADDELLARIRAAAKPYATDRPVMAEFYMAEDESFTLGRVSDLSGSDAALLRAARRYGWAITARIFALSPDKESDSDNGTGRPDSILWPTSERLEHAARVKISREDGHIQLLSWGEDRGQAASALRYSLDGAINDGAPNTLELISAILPHDRFERGEIDTKLIDEEFPNGFEPSALGINLGIGHSRHFAGLCAIFQSRISGCAQEHTRWNVRINDDAFTVQLEPETDHVLTAIDEDSDKATVEIAVKTDWLPSSRVAYCWIDERLMIVQINQVSGGFKIAYRGARLSAALSRL